MASAIAQGAGALFNAFAFAGASFAFSKIGQGDLVAETKRHDLAMEKFNREKEQWSEARLNELDRIDRLHNDQREAERDREETLNDFVRYARLQETKQKRNDVETVNKIFARTRPKFSDYYKPSKEFQKYVDWMKYVMSVALTSAIMFVVV